MHMWLSFSTSILGLAWLFCLKNTTKIGSIFIPPQSVSHTDRPESDRLSYKEKNYAYCKTKNTKKHFSHVFTLTSNKTKKGFLIISSFKSTSLISVQLIQIFMFDTKFKFKY